MVVERLGGLTYLYVQVDPQPISFIVHADGDVPVKVQDVVAVTLEPRLAHLFRGDGIALNPLERNDRRSETTPDALAKRVGQLPVGELAIASEPLARRYLATTAPTFAWMMRLDKAPFAVQKHVADELRRPVPAGRTRRRCCASAS